MKVNEYKLRHVCKDPLVTRSLFSCIHVLCTCQLRNKIVHSETIEKTTKKKSQQAAQRPKAACCYGNPEIVYFLSPTVGLEINCENSVLERLHPWGGDPHIETNILQQTKLLNTCKYSGWKSMPGSVSLMWNKDCSIVLFTLSSQFKQRAGWQKFWLGPETRLVI